MNYNEKLTWILDRKNKTIADAQVYRENIDFVHSLGKKCDCVGWSELSMDEADADAVLASIRECCNENGWLARGIYERTYTDFESDWYELKTDDFKDNTVFEVITAKGENGEEIQLDVIRAYRELTSSPKERFGIYVSERFRNACIKNNIADVDFCWIPDKGKYKAEQYFCMQPLKTIPRIAHTKGLNVTHTERLQALGGALPVLGSIFYNLQLILLPDFYLKKDLPDGGIVCAYSPKRYSYCSHCKILIHKATAECLIAEKALSRSNLIPACVVDECPVGYVLEETAKMPKIAAEYIENAYRQYEELKAKDRPQYAISEKEALKLLRKTKSERKVDFNKKLNKKCAEQIENTAYTVLLPYYMVCDGGLLSDEYTFLPYNESLVATERFFEELKKEELLTAKPDGIVIAACIDGDFVLAKADGRVVRFSHEAPEVINEWQGVAAFFADAINEV